jgi:hypothetical protein
LSRELTLITANMEVVKEEDVMIMGDGSSPDSSQLA